MLSPPFLIYFLHMVTPFMVELCYQSLSIIRICYSFCSDAKMHVRALMVTLLVSGFASVKFSNACVQSCALKHAFSFCCAPISSATGYSVVIDRAEWVTLTHIDNVLGQPQG